MSAVFVSPAKINLTLRVLYKRLDGFHEIETLMVPVSIFDRIEIDFTDTNGVQFACSDPSLAGADNLVVKAAELFCNECGLVPQLRIRLLKEIPHGAGLGGGSSDAATVLQALNALYKTEMTVENLTELAATIGSDVPFFLHGSPAWCYGRGERVEPLYLGETLSLLLIKPPFGVSTPAAYKDWADSKPIPGIPYEPQKFSWGSLINDLERPVFQKHLFLAEMKRWLQDQQEVRGALMSGSGSTMIAILQSPEDAFPLGEKIANHFGTNLWCHACHTLDAIQSQ